MGVLTGFGTALWSLLTFGLLRGLFESGNWPCGIRTTWAVLRPEERSFGNLLFQSGTTLGAVLSPALESTRERAADAAMAVTGGTYEAISRAPDNTWQFPLRGISSVGLVWIVLWFVLVPRRMFVNATGGVFASQADTGLSARLGSQSDSHGRLGVVFRVSLTTLHVRGIAGGWRGYFMVQAAGSPATAGAGEPLAMRVDATPI